MGTASNCNTQTQCRKSIIDMNQSRMNGFVVKLQKNAQNRRVISTQIGVFDLLCRARFLDIDCLLDDFKIGNDGCFWYG